MSEGDKTPAPNLDDTTKRSNRANVSNGSVLSDTYRIIRQIASGGMGAVFEAEHLRLVDHHVAIKVLLPEVSGDQETKARFQREAEICSSLQHPHIVKVTDFNALEDGTPYLVMEYLEGESLAIRMAQGPISRDLAHHILRQMAAALEAAHSQGIVHRDLKPSNVFLAKDESSDQPQVKILDFGISKLLNQKTLNLNSGSALMGTPHYMSPEQAEGRNQDIGPASDQFSLAAIAIELLTGQQAFRGDTLASTLYQVVHAEPEGLDLLNKEYSASMVTTFRHALAKDPAQRFASVSEFIEELKQGFSEQTEERPSSLLSKPSTSSKTGFIKILGAVAIVAGLTWLILPSKPTEPPPAKIAPKKQAAPVKKIETTPELPLPEPEPEPITPTKPTRPPKKKSTDDGQLDEILYEARQNFDRKNYRETIRLGQQSLLLTPTGRAHLLMTLSYCALGELSKAQLSYKKIPTSRRPGTLSHCRHFGMELEPK